jgi:NO-binding membrane sensor protein with MHYT domain
MIRRFENVAGPLQRWLMGTLVLGLTGTAIELLLLEHYDEPWQLVPLLLIALAFAVLAWHRARSTTASVRALRMTMLMFVVSSAAGVVLHFRAAAQFQLEIDPAMPTPELIRKVMRVKDPPVLAPGVMLQLGLIGLAYAYACRASPTAAPAATNHHKE